MIKLITRLITEFSFGAFFRTVAKGKQERGLDRLTADLTGGRNDY